jgi:hypothetical protein
MGLSNFSPSRSNFGYSHPAAASRPTQIVTPPGPRTSHTTFTETRCPLQNSFSPAVVGSTANMASPLPLQHANTVYYVGDIFILCWITRFRVRSRWETPSIALSIARWITLSLWTNRTVSVSASRLPMSWPVELMTCGADTWTLYVVGFFMLCIFCFYVICLRQ